MNEFILIGIMIGFSLSALICFVFAALQDNAIILTKKQTEELVDFIIRLNREDSKKILDIIK